MPRILPEYPPLRQVGVIAQEVGAEVPGAVEGGGGVTLASGRQLDTVLRVNKDTLFMGKLARELNMTLRKKGAPKNKE